MPEPSNVEQHSAGSSVVHLVVHLLINILGPSSAVALGRATIRPGLSQDMQLQDTSSAELASPASISLVVTSKVQDPTTEKAHPSGPASTQTSPVNRAAAVASTRHQSSEGRSEPGHVMPVSPSKQRRSSGKRQQGRSGHSDDAEEGSSRRAKQASPTEGTAAAAVGPATLTAITR